MKKPLAALALSAAIVIGTNAEAQVVAPGPTIVGTEYVVGAPYPGHNAGVAIPYYGASFTGAYRPPYSYYAAPYPLPARYYVGYGANDYPFYGRPYGHASDPWTWQYLSGGGQRSLARYFYPPL